jgi:murein DD-endopeptidase MepM/ murein hydrolase activator NlpD
MLASAVSAQLTKKLADAQAAVALADAQVETSSRRLARLQREIRSLAMALYRHLDRTEPLAAVDTARSVDLARAREYSRAPATVLDQRVAEAQTVRAGLTAARGRAVTSRDESARVSADAATAAEQLREQLAAAERADAAAMQSVIEALGSGAAVLGLVADPRFGADSITAALAITQAGQGDPVTLLGLFHTPVPGAPLGSPFGVRVDPLDGGISFHPGIDLEAGMGQPVHAAAGGTVVLSGDCGGYGNCVVIDHGHSVATLYAHQSRVLVQVGSPVADDQTIGLVGSTGKSTGPHLHFEVRLHGVPVDPLLALAA